MRPDLQLRSYVARCRKQRLCNSSIPMQYDSTKKYLIKFIWEKWKLQIKHRTTALLVFSLHLFLIILRSAALPSYNLCVDYTFGFVYFVVCAVGIFVVRFVCALCFNCRMLIFMAFILMWWAHNRTFRLHTNEWIFPI